MNFFSSVVNTRFHIYFCKRAILAIGLFIFMSVLSVAPVKADQIFPPKNSNNAPNCPTGKTLRWENGAVNCFSASILSDSDLSGFNITSCTGNKYMIGISNGKAICSNKLISTGCGSGYFLTGFTSAGEPVCTNAAKVLMDDNLQLGGGLLCGGYAEGVSQAPGTFPCVVNGATYNPSQSCPPNYVRVGGDFQSPGNRYWYTCVKMSKSIFLPTAGILCGGYADGVSQAPGNNVCGLKNSSTTYTAANNCPSGYSRVGGDFQSPENRYWYSCVKR